MMKKRERRGISQFQAALVLHHLAEASQCHSARPRGRRIQESQGNERQHDMVVFT